MSTESNQPISSPKAQQASSAPTDDHQSNDHQSNDHQSNEKTRLLLKIHGWSGVFLGLLLYAVILTGTIAVFEDEINNWANPLPNHPESAFGPGLDQAVRGLAEQIDPRYLEEVSVFPVAGERLRVLFHGHIEVEEGGEHVEVEEGADFLLDPASWQVLEERTGVEDELNVDEQAGALGEFLVNLHVRLYVPEPWGLILTGVLGLSMMIAAISGVVLHRKLLRELFLLRISRRNPLLTAKDRHVLAGTWNLLFAFLLAFTGSFFSFAASFGIPAMAMVAFGGDQEKLIETVIGVPEASDPTPTPFAGLDRMLADAQQRVDAEVGSIFIQRWGQADALVSVGISPEEGRLTGRTLVYDGATGAFLREKPILGLSPSLGGTLVALMAPLHFGSFAGLASKAVWFGLGIASAYVVLSGMLLWTRRRQDQPVWQRFQRWVYWMGYGLPLALAATPAGYFLAPWLGIEATTAVKSSFLLAVLLVSVMVYVLRDLDQLRKLLLAFTAGLLLLAPVLRWLVDGMGWGNALNTGWTLVAAVDLLLLVSAALYIWQSRRQPSAAHSGQMALSH